MEKCCWTLVGRLVNVTRLYVPADWPFSELDSYLPTETGDRYSVFLDDCISKRWLPGPSERHFWVVEDLQRTEKEFTIASLLK